MSPTLDITKNNASNLQLISPEGELPPELHAVTQSVETLREFLTDSDMVTEPYTDAYVDMLSKNDLIFAVREFVRTGGLVVASVEITGDDTVAEEDSVQLVAEATYGVGITIDVTALATWASSDEAKATVEGGVVLGIAAGTTNITATFGGKTSDPLEVTVTS